jgi:signal transduction histidine kinase
MQSHNWKEQASCKDYDWNLFFDKYEEDVLLRGAIDKLCSECPVAKQCFAVGVSQKEWGVWGGVYLENGKVSREFSKHRSKKDWGNVWKKLTIDYPKK